MGQQARLKCPVTLPQLLPASLLPRAGAKGLSQGLKNVPREGGGGGEELGGQFWGGLEMPLADLRPEPANLDSGVAQNSCSSPWFPHIPSS